EDIVPGDIILKVDGKEVNKPNQLQSYIATKRAGTEVHLTLFRDGKEISRDVTLKARDKDKGDSVELVGTKKEKKNDSGELKEASFDAIGLTVQDLTQSLKKKYKVENGILVKDVEQFSKAADQRLFPGLVILEVDKKPINSVKEFKNIIESKSGDAILLKVANESGNSSFIGLEIPEK
ncbi:MAG: PDZ domain-containing protein, partial [Ignavibacteriae bacterium]|nr:PDZ domain-containing protein [Ignavibacteriota bacterium]